MKQICIKCDVEKDIVEFNKNKNTKSGYLRTCKQCSRLISHQYYLQHRIACIKSTREWQRLNWKRFCKNNNKYNQSFKGRMNIRRRRIRRRLGLSTLTTEMMIRVYEENIIKYGVLTCEYCLRPISVDNDTIEHKIPISRRDEYRAIDVNGRRNLCVTDLQCNLSKGSLTPNEFLDVRPELMKNSIN